MRGGASDIVIGGGGSVSVADAALYSRMHRLQGLEVMLEQCRRDILAIDRIATTDMLVLADAPLSAMYAERAIDDTEALLVEAARLCDALTAALHSSAMLYGFIEEGATRVGQSLAADLAARFGFVATVLRPLLVPALLLAVAGVGTGVALARAVDPDAAESALRELGKQVDAHRGVLSDPRFVELVRYAAMSVDDGMAGAAGVPPPLIRALGDEGLGLFGVDTAAAAIVGATGIAGVLRETPVRVTASTPSAVPIPEGFADRADRVPRGPAQVRVDRVVHHGRPDRFEVYLAGTIDFGPVARSEAWDLTSNMSAMAGAEPASYRAVTEALAASGVQTDSPITVTGYSQGGLIGSMLAASGDYHVTGLYTLGAPAGQVAVPDSVPWVAIEHTDDLVPAVGGTWASADPLLLRREAFADRPLDPASLFPAHQLEYYRETAALADTLDEQRVSDAAARFDAFTSGADRVESTLYTAERVPKGSR